jgi:hypothetical protein
MMTEWVVTWEYRGEQKTSTVTATDQASAAWLMGLCIAHLYPSTLPRLVSVVER